MSPGDGFLSPKEFIDVMQKRKDGGFNAVWHCIYGRRRGGVFFYSNECSASQMHGQRRDTGAFELIKRVKRCIEDCV